MSALPDPAAPRALGHLHVVTINEQTGETREGCPHCAARAEEEQRLEDVIEGLQRDIAGWAARHAELKRDKAAEAKADPLWPNAVRLFRFYCRLTGKPGKPRRLTWTVERFEEVRPFLKKHGLAMCERAIVGRVFDHHIGQRRNGSPIHYHEWGRIFGAMGKGSAAENFEESCRRAPLDFVSELAAEDEAREAAEAERLAAEKHRREDEHRGQRPLAADG